MIATSLNALERYAQWTDLYVERLYKGNYLAVILAHCPNGYKFDFAEAARFSQMAPLGPLPIIIFDFREYGWNTSHKNCDLAGFQREEQPMYHGDEWENLDGWLKGQNIVAYFKREFSPEVGQLTPPFPVYPIDLISGRNGFQFTPSTKDEFLSRPYQVLHWWGHSHEDRVWLNSALLDTPEVRSICKCVNHLERMALAKVLELQSTCQTSVSLGGCGVKCFRMSESCVNSVPIIADLGMRWSVPWTQENAVLLPTVDGRIDPQQALGCIVEALQDKETLWQKYLAAQESARALDQDGYMANIINPLILSHL